MRSPSTFFFVHIPKTAGTSFRRALADAVGHQSCHFDYGPDSVETSPLVRRFSYEEADLFRLQRALAKAGCRLLGGHVHASRYAPLVSTTQIVSFVRDPVQQLVSHFEHYRRDNGYKGTLSDFMRAPQGLGLQSRLLAAMPIEAMGFIGVTERYDESLQAFNAAYGMTIDARRLNVNPANSHRTAASDGYAVPDDARGLLDERGRQDKMLYRRVNAMLDARLKAIASGVPFVHGALSSVTPTHVTGFAYFATSQQPVRVQVVVNGRVVHAVRATGDCPALRARALKVPRNGFVGFDYRPSSPLAEGDRVLVRVAATGQELGALEVQIAKGGARPAAMS